MNAVEFHEEADRIYLDVGGVEDSSGRCPSRGTAGRLRLKSQRRPDALVWNPWVEKSKKMGDFRDDEYREMVCVSRGHEEDVHVPGTMWEGFAANFVRGVSSSSSRLLVCLLSAWHYRFVHQLSIQTPSPRPGSDPPPRSGGKSS